MEGLATSLVWTSAIACSSILAIAALHHLRASAHPLGDGLLSNPAISRLLGAGELVVAAAVAATGAASGTVRFAVGLVVVAIGFAFVVVSARAARSGRDCGCLPLGSGERQSSIVPALIVLASGVALTALAGFDLGGHPLAVPVLQGLALGAITWLFAAASAAVELPSPALVLASTNRRGRP